ncbi:MAG: MG2 domain-containing protein, partial [bacterium]
EMIFKIANRRRPILAGFAAAAVLLFALYLGQVSSLPGLTYSKGVQNAKLEIPSSVSPNSAIPVNISLWDEVIGKDEITRDTTSVNYMLTSDDGNPVIEREISAASYGMSQDFLDLKGIKPGHYNLKAKIDGRDVVSVPLSIANQYEISILSDRPIYRPGDEIKIRVTAREYSSSAASNVDASFVLRGPLDGLVKHESKKLSSYGTANFNYKLADIVPLGEYILTVKVGKNESVKKIIVDDFTLPRFSIDVNTDRDYITRSSIFKGTVNANYFFGQPLKYAQVGLEWFVIDGLSLRQITRIDGQTNDSGEFPFAIDIMNLYPELEKLKNETRESYLKVTLIDSAHQREEIIKQYSMSADPVIIRMFTQNGKINYGLKNKLFLITTLPGGEPVSCSLNINIAGRDMAAETSILGVYSFDYFPELSDTDLTVTATLDGEQPVTRKMNFEFAYAQFPFIIRSKKAVYSNDELIELELNVPDAMRFNAHLDVYKDNRWVASKIVDITDPVTNVTWLVSEAWGELTVKASLLLDHKEISSDKTKIFKEAPDDLKITIKTDKDTYLPGEQVGAKVNVDAIGGPKQASLGVVAADKSLIAAGEKADTTSMLLSETLFAGLENTIDQKVNLSTKSERAEFSEAVMNSRITESKTGTPENAIGYKITPDEAKRNSFEYLVLANYSSVVTRFILAGLLYICVILSMITALINIHKGSLGKLTIGMKAMGTLRSYAGWTSLTVLFFALSIAYPSLWLIGLGLALTIGVAIALANCFSQNELLANATTLVQLISSTGIVIASLLLAHQGIWKQVFQWMGKMNPLMSASLLSILASIGCLVIVATFFIPQKGGENQ